MDSRSAIERCFKSKTGISDTIRKVYYCHPTHALRDNPEAEYRIRSRIATFFRAGIHSIQFAGSGKTGYSFHQQKNFEPGISDLDAAIIDHSIFIELCEHVSIITDSYQRVDKFYHQPGKPSNDRLLRDGVSKFGMFNFRLMPDCQRKREVNKFFSELSREFSNIFSDINGVVYASAYFFEAKQKTSLTRTLLGG